MRFSDYDEEGPELPPEAGDIDDPHFDPDDKWIASAPRDLQIEAMRQWFYARYEDPANQTPYSSQEGGYIFVWGGPYDPNDVIQERFSHVVTYEVMDELIHDLWNEVGDAWAPIEPEGREDYYDELSFLVVNRNDPFNFLQGRLEQIDAVLAVECSVAASELIHQMLHSSLIAALEAYLADTLTFWVGNDKEALRRFISRNKDFKARSLTLDQLFERLDALDDEVKRYLQDLIWHRLDKIKPMLQAGLDIVVPDIEDLMKEVVIRHDIVHRAGRTRDGGVVSVSAEDVRRVREMVRVFGLAIEAELVRRFPPPEEKLAM
jgi:hypothetical protein